MKKGLLLALAIVCCASLVFAQAPGSVGIYADNTGSSCEIAEVGVVTLHFIHVNDACATAVEFKADVSALSLGMHFGDNSPFALKIGLFKDGASISYGASLTGNIYLGSTTWLSGAGNVCQKVYAIAHPVPSVPTTGPLGVGCPSGWLYLRGSYAVVSTPAGFENCHCPGTVPNEETSWGQIKSLYE
jgi:hypothetical protein